METRIKFVAADNDEWAEGECALCGESLLYGPGENADAHRLLGEVCGRCFSVLPAEDRHVIVIARRVLE